MAEPFATIVDDYRMTKAWLVTLPVQFERRFEDDSLVIWRPGLTFWIDVWNNDNHERAEERMNWILEAASPERMEERVLRGARGVRLSYELDQRDADPSTPCHRSLSAYVIAEAGYVQISAYCDDPDALALAYAVVGSVRTAGDHA